MFQYCPDLVCACNIVWPSYTLQCFLMRFIFRYLLHASAWPGTQAHIHENARLLGQSLEKVDADLRRPRLTNDQLARIDDLDGRVDQHRDCAVWAAAGGS